MSFECAVVMEGQRCQNPEQGDATYLRVLTFCATHQEAFEEIVSAHVLANEVASARVWRTEVGKIVKGWLSQPRTEQASHGRRDMRYEATVYFIRCDGFVKIGYSVAPHMRLRQIQSMDGTKYPAGIDCSGASLIQTEPGGFDRERELHAKFKHLRHTGEWFTEAPELTEYISAVQAAA